jgi:hypothetical protein
MPEPTNNQKPSLDERLEALVQTAELQHHEIAQLNEISKRNELASQRNEREIQRFRRAMRAALQAWISEDDEPQG